jgi:hypothetical protein
MTIEVEDESGAAEFFAFDHVMVNVSGLNSAVNVSVLFAFIF